MDDERADRPAPEDVLVGLVVLAAIRWALGSPLLPAVHPERAVAVGVAAYAVLFSFVTVGRHYAFRTHALDLGQYAQNLWQLARGREPYDTILAGTPGATTSVRSSICWPPDAGLLGARLPARPAVGGSGAGRRAAVLARPRSGRRRAAAAIALLYLLNPSLQGINVRDFHPAALAVPLLLTAMLAAERRRFALFGLATLLTLATREDAAIAVVASDSARPRPATVDLRWCARRRQHRLALCGDPVRDAGFRDDAPTRT